MLAQGSLTPPGAPAATMQTLDQLGTKADQANTKLDAVTGRLEKRTPISSVPFTISASGSYYLTTNLSVTMGDAITIGASGVTLDLNGFSISSSNPSRTGTAILINSGLSNIIIQNGSIVSGVSYSGGSFDNGGGFGNGINATGTAPVSVRVWGITVSGVRASGIYVGNSSSVIQSCTVHVAGGIGIHGDVIKDSSAYECGSLAISGTNVTDSHGESVAGGTGVFASETASNCYGGSNHGIGVTAQTVSNCTGYSNTIHGIIAYNSAVNCFGESGGAGYGVYGYNKGASVMNCSGVSDSSYGVYGGVVTNSNGVSNTGIGLYADKVAMGCYGSSTSGASGLTCAGTASFCSGLRPNGTAISCVVAIGCSTSGGSITAPLGKYLGTP